jgi:hypothetical protein
LLAVLCSETTVSPPLDSSLSLSRSRTAATGSRPCSLHRRSQRMVRPHLRPLYRRRRAHGAHQEPWRIRAQRPALHQRARAAGTHAVQAVQHARIRIELVACGTHQRFVGFGRLRWRRVVGGGRGRDWRRFSSSTGLACALTGACTGSRHDCRRRCCSRRGGGGGGGTTGTGRVWRSSRGSRGLRLARDQMALGAVAARVALLAANEARARLLHGFEQLARQLALGVGPHG